jgi:rhodanese-related sulfurtransferase
VSARAALFLRKQGYDAWALEGGMKAWIAAGYPTEERVSVVRENRG